MLCRIVFADDHRTAWKSMKNAIRETPHMEVIGEAVDGCLLKEDADITLLSAVAGIREDGQFISSILNRKPTEGSMQMHNDNSGTSMKELTTREIEILTLLAEGRTSREIGELLHLSIHTVENHRSKIRKKLGMRKNIQLIRYAVGKGYISLD